jgi:general secretion pathway protein J
MTGRGPARDAAGFVIVEALVALILISMTLALFATTLTFARRVADAGGLRERLADAATGVDAMAGLLAGALPVREPTPTGQTRVLFEGRPDALSFVTLSSGETQAGGMLAVTIGFAAGRQRSGPGVFFSSSPIGLTTPPSLTPAGIPLQPLSRKMMPLQFSYFGSPVEGRPVRWHDEWANATRLPRLVGLRAGLDRNGRMEIVDLRFPVFSQ